MFMENRSLGNDAFQLCFPHFFAVDCFLFFFLYGKGTRLHSGKDGFELVSATSNFMMEGSRVG